MRLIARAGEGGGERGDRQLGYRARAAAGGGGGRARALAWVLGGAFSRLGYGARIAAAGAAGVGVRVLGFVAGAAADGNASLNFLQYSPPLVCFIVCMLIVLRQHPARGPRRAPTPALAQPLPSPA